MNKLLIAGLLFLPCIEMAAAGGPGPSVRQMNSTDGDRLDAEGQHTSRRFRQNRLDESTGSGVPNSGGGNVGTGGGSITVNGSGYGNGSVWDSLFEPDHHPSVNTQVNGSPWEHAPDADNRIRYSAPEPGGYSETLVFAATGLALFLIKRFRAA